MSSDAETQKMVLRPFTRRGNATANGNIGGTTVVSLWDPAVPEGLQEGDNYWRESQLLIQTGDMRNQVRDVTGFVQATGVLTVAPRFVNPNVSLLSGDILALAVTIPVVDASAVTSGSPLALDVALAAAVIIVDDASQLRAGNAVIYDDTGASEAILIVAIVAASNVLVLAAPLAAAYLVADDAAVSMADAYIWDDAPNTEAVTITAIDVTLNQLTIAPGVVAGYTVAANAAISVSPMIRDGVEFTLMPPTKTVDSGTHTNPQQWLHDNNWSPDEITIAAAGAPGEQPLGAAVAAGALRRLRELSIVHEGTNNTVVTVLDATLGNIVLRVPVPAATMVIWSSEDGRPFAAATQPVIQTSDITGGSTFVTCAGVEAPQT